MPQWNSFDDFLAEAQRTTSVSERQSLVNQLLRQRKTWPWVQGERATFVFSQTGVKNVAVNLDTIPTDPPFEPMTNLPGTTLWYVTREFSRDDLLDYMLAVDDPMTPLASEPDVMGRVAKYWRVDPLNPQRMDTPQMNVSVLRMDDARPFPDWATMTNVPRGRIAEHSIDSKEVGFKERRLWVYTPPNYDGSGMAYPLLILNDGQWGIGPLQVPFIANALIKHGRMEPAVIAMIQSGTQQERLQEYVSNDAYYAFLLVELLPFLQTQYRIDSTNLGIGGVAMGAIAAMHAALKNPAVFSNLIAVSPPMGKGPMSEELIPYIGRFENASALPKRIFQSVGRYEARPRFYRPALELSDILGRRREVAYKFAEIGSGHGLVGFRSIFPEALAWALASKSASVGR